MVEKKKDHLGKLEQIQKLIGDDVYIQLSIDKTGKMCVHQVIPYEQIFEIQTEETAE